MPELVNHNHCKNCGRAVKFGIELCGPECEGQWKEFQKKRSRTVLFFYVVGAVLMVILVLQLTGFFTI